MSFYVPPLLRREYGLSDIPTLAQDMERVLVEIREILNGYPVLLKGNGSPESAVTAQVGALYCRLDGGTGTTLYVKETGSGNTGWVAK